MVLMALLVTHSLSDVLIYGFKARFLGKEQARTYLHYVPGFGHPRFNPLLLCLVDGNLQTVALAGTLWVTWPIADGTICRIVPVHVGWFCKCWLSRDVIFRGCQIQRQNSAIALISRIVGGGAIRVAALAWGIDSGSEIG
jgi:hypothetical protein